MKARTWHVVALSTAIFVVGCKPASNAPVNSNGSSTLDFESLLASVDNSIGKRFQSMQMDGMESATYQYDGTIQPVVDIIAPAAKQAGFSEDSSTGSNGKGVAEAEMSEKLGVDMTSVEQKVFKHPNGELISIARMDISSDDSDMKMLTIQLMNPNQLAGLGNAVKAPTNPTTTGATSGSPKHIQAWVDSWANMGMYLPDDEQVQFLQANMKDVLPELRDAISHKNADVRQRAAYVIAEIGPDANDLGESLFEQLKKEQEQIVQIYLIDALGAVRFKDDKVVEFLKTKYASLSDENVAPTMFSGGKYSDVDEKINLAGILYVLSDEDSQGEYVQFVTQWLAPASDDMSPTDISGYWERRWMAVNSLEGMKGAPGAIPLLEAMLTEAKAKSWVPIHVPRVLEALREHESQSGGATK